MSPLTREALRLLALSIKSRRVQRGWSIDELALRVGVSHPTIIKVERGEPGVAVGTVLEAATLVGVPLFDEQRAVRERHLDRLESEIRLLPAAAREVSVDVDDDF